MCTLGCLQKTKRFKDSAGWIITVNTKTILRVKKWEFPKAGCFLIICKPTYSL